jgi:RHS repeat-associated protein
MYIWTKQPAKTAKAGGPAIRGANRRKIVPNWLRACAPSRSKGISFLVLLVFSLAGSFPARAQMSGCESILNYYQTLPNYSWSCWIQAPPNPNSPPGTLIVACGNLNLSEPPVYIDYLEGCSVSSPAGSPQSAPNPPPSSSCSAGSIIHNDNQALGETVPVVGVPFRLVYFSDRVAGRVQAYTAQVPYYGGMEVQYLGRLSQVAPNGTFVWDGLDSSMNPVQGSINGAAGYYAGQGCSVAGIINDAFDCTGNYCPAAGSCTSVPFFVPFFSVTVGTYRADLLGLGGWSPSILHYYDPNAKILYFGDGSNRPVTASNYGNGTQLIAGNNDGSELYVFNLSGNHLYTLNGLTGSVLYTFAYDSYNHLSTITDAYGNVTTVLRNGSGVLTGIQSPYGQVTTFTLDPNGFLATITNPNNETYTMTYYGAGGLLNTFQKPLGQVSTMTYDSNGLLTLDSSSAGNSTALSSMSGSPGNTTVQATDALSLVTGFAVSSQPSSYTRTTTFPDTTTDTFSLTPNGSESDTSPSNAYQLSYAPDARLGSIANFTPSSSVQSWTQNATQTLSGWTASGDPNNPNYFTYTGIDTQSTVNGNLWDANFTLATGGTMITSPKDREFTVTADTFGKPTQLQLASYTPITFAYDAHGRALHINQGTSRKTSIAYFSTGHSNGLVSKITNALSQSTSFTYDKAGRVLTEILPDSRVITFTYDSDGNLKSVTPPSTPPHDFAFNPFDLPATYAPPLLAGNPTITQYSYDNDERLTQIQRPDGNSVALAYDPTKGVLTTITLPTGANSYSISAGLLNSAVSADQVSDAFSYSYNQLTGDAVTLNGSSIGSVGLTENSDFNLTTSVVTPAVGSASSIGYTYDADTLLTGAGAEQITETPKTGQLKETTLGKIGEAYTYSPTFGEVATYLSQVSPHSTSPKTILEESYTRDNLGRISSKSETEGTTVTTYSYTYDPAGRLTAVTKNGSPYSSYVYDGNSNRSSGDAGGLSFSAGYDAQDRLLTYNTKSYTYTPNGDRLSVTDASLPAGHQTTSYTFDELGNLKQVSLPNKTVTYLVDGLNRRVAKKVGSATQAQYLYRDQYRIEAILGPTGAVVDRFVWGTKSNVPDYLIKGVVTYKIISDERGSVRFVVNTATGVTAQQIEYDEFGNVLTDTNPGFQPFGFAGGLYDTDTGLVHFGAREYDASVGRWLSKDPLLFGGGDTNLYGYVLGDPINTLDPNGKIGYSPGFGLFGVVAGAIAGGISGGAQSAVVSAATGVLAGITGLTLSEVIVAGAVIGGTQYVALQLWNGQSVDPGQLFIASAIGGFGSAIGAGISGWLLDPFPSSTFPIVPYPEVTTNFATVGSNVTSALLNSCTSGDSAGSGH